MWLILGTGVSGRAAGEFINRHHSGPIYYYQDGIKPPQHPLKGALLDQRQAVAILLRNPQITVIASPGFSPRHPIMGEAHRLGCVMLSEIDLALSKYQPEIIGITGTNGKSTVTTYVKWLVESQGYSCSVAGNIGTPLTSVAACGSDYFATELSSYQLAQSSPIPMKIAIFYNFSPDHLEWHGDYDSYFQAKWKIVSKAEICLISPEVRDEALTRSLTIPDNTRVIDRHETFPTLSLHDRINLTFAKRASEILTGKKIEISEQMLQSAPQLPYRFQRYTTSSGHSIINDSKSTNSASLEASLKTVADNATVFIGGIPKDVSGFSILNTYKDKIRCCVVFGPQSRDIAGHISRDISVTCFKNLKLACRNIDAIPQESPILFSPGGASFDEFENYLERGAFFDSAVSSKL